MGYAYQVRRHRHVERSFPSSRDDGHDRQGTGDLPWPNAIGIYRLHHPPCRQKRIFQISLSAMGKYKNCWLRCLGAQGLPFPLYRHRSINNCDFLMEDVKRTMAVNYFTIYTPGVEKRWWWFELKSGQSTNPGQTRQFMCAYLPNHVGYRLFVKAKPGQNCRLTQRGERLAMSLFSSWPVRGFFSRNTHHLFCLRRSFCATSLRLQDGQVPPSSSQRNTIDIEGPSVNPNDLQPLNRPLGVRERPTTTVKTRTERMKALMDQDVRLAERRHLYVISRPPDRGSDLDGRRIKEASKGYFHDMNMTRKHGGKTWIAPKVLIREDVRGGA